MIAFLIPCLASTCNPNGTDEEDISKKKIFTYEELLKAKEKGQVSKSVELITNLSLLVILGMITAMWPKILFELKNISTHLLVYAAKNPFDLDHIVNLQQSILTKLLNLWLPFALVTVMTIVLATISQTGLVWSTTPI